MSRDLHRTELSLPPRAALAYAGPDDPLEYYYRPHTAWLYRARLRLALRVLGEGPYDSLLEVGYGSGILLPELTRRADRVTAIDVHPHRQAVEMAMDGLGVGAKLMDASLFEIPFPADEFDALVCLSVLEHVTELDAAFEELTRVLRPGGVAVIGFPVRNPLTDGLFRMLGYHPREIHPSSHTDIVRAGQRSANVRLERSEQLPRLLPRPLSAYVVIRLLATAGPKPTLN
jgi:2-polyprenyl-3-methyl-5-hydroxy-6-metoxy-1,4-benzoquinol methylase